MSFVDCVTGCFSWLPCCKKDSTEKTAYLRGDAHYRNYSSTAGMQRGKHVDRASREKAIGFLGGRSVSLVALEKNSTTELVFASFSPSSIGSADSSDVIFNIIEDSPLLREGTITIDRRSLTARYSFLFRGDTQFGEPFIAEGEFITPQVEQQPGQGFERYTLSWRNALRVIAVPGQEFAPADHFSLAYPELYLREMEEED